VVINPISTGTGLKIKNIEALGYGKPLVTTSVGAVGMENGSHSAFLAADTAQDFANAVIGLLQDSKVYRRFSMSGYQFAKEWNRQQMEALRMMFDNGHRC
jgi:glycosyltransferase involved in cell wall biosynthesis